MAQPLGQWIPRSCPSVPLDASVVCEWCNAPTKVSRTRTVTETTHLMQNWNKNRKQNACPKFKRPSVEAPSPTQTLCEADHSDPGESSPDWRYLNTKLSRDKNLARNQPRNSL